MTAFVRKLALVIATAAGTSIGVFFPASGEAGAIHQAPQFTIAAEADVMRVRCDRRLSNLWSCNDEVRSRSRRNVQGRDSYAYRPCAHSYQTARDGSRCGNRAADRRPGGR